MLLDETVTTIWEVDDGKVTVYSGNYSDYEAQKELENSSTRMLIINTCVKKRIWKKQLQTK